MNRPLFVVYVKFVSSNTLRGHRSSCSTETMFGVLCRLQAQTLSINTHTMTHILNCRPMKLINKEMTMRLDWLSESLQTIIRGVAMHLYCRWTWYCYTHDAYAFIGANHVINADSSNTYTAKCCLWSHNPRLCILLWNFLFRNGYNLHWLLYDFIHQDKNNISCKHQWPSKCNTFLF